jgi:SPX domain protein involved in polyphosphate accumulation
MSRLEFKYYLGREKLDSLRRDILPFLSYDRFMPNSEKREYTVRSVYLDSNSFLTYNEKLSGIKDRNKYRIRGYNNLNDDSIVFLEIKRKDNDHISKDRAPLFYRNLENFLRTKDYSLLLDSRDFTKKNAYAGNFLYYFLFYSLRPVSVITYEREAFECKFGTGLRITFDKNIRTRITNSYSDLFDNDKMIHTFKDKVVLEIKFNKIIPGWVPEIMKKYDILHDSISKYSGSIDVSYKNDLNRYTN